MWGCAVHLASAGVKPGSALLRRVRRATATNPDFLLADRTRESAQSRPRAKPGALPQAPRSVGLEDLPVGRVCLGAHLMPIDRISCLQRQLAGLEATSPAPLPKEVMLTREVPGGGAGCAVKAPVKSWSASMMRLQTPVPEQVPCQLAKAPHESRLNAHHDPVTTLKLGLHRRSLAEPRHGQSGALASAKRLLKLGDVVDPEVAFGKATTLRRPPQGQSRTSSRKTRRKSSAQIRAGGAGDHRGALEPRAARAHHRERGIAGEEGSGAGPHRAEG